MTHPAAWGECHLFAGTPKYQQQAAKTGARTPANDRPARGLEPAFHD
jgi:hypothetical protein